MAKQRVLIQDIADSLHLSRTTVSKVLNGSSNVSQKNKERVLEKAAELNYKQFSLLSPPAEDPVISPSAPPSIHGNIAFLFHKFPDKQHIGSSLLASFEQEISKEGYTLSLFTIQDEDIRNLKLPNTFISDNIDALFCVELFDRDYCRMLCTLNKPLLFVDSYYKVCEDNLNADLILMDSRYSSASMIRHLITANNLTRAGFIGAFTHCLSFYERWTGFCMALQDCGVPLNKSSCIISQDDSKYWDRLWLITQLKLMDPFPELFVCANDSLAIQLISCLKELNISIPSDVLVTGFDNTPASMVVEPSLTTINSHSTNMGIAAAKQLLNRIASPALPFARLYLQTEILYRDSTDIRLRRPVRRLP